MYTKLTPLAGVLIASPAFAQADAAQGSPMGSVLMMGVIFIMMYFMMIRPQNKRAKAHQKMLADIAQGDEVVTQGGLVGKVLRDTGTFFIIQFADKVEVPIQKQSVTQLLPKGTLKSL